MTDNLKPYDPRPEWMQQYHKETTGGANRFKEWAKQSLNIDIDDQLQYDQGIGKADMASQVLQAITMQMPFILHNGPQRFCIIIPKIQIIATYTRNGNTTEILDAKQFQNRVKMLYVIYPQFSPASLKLIQSALELAIQQWKVPSKKMNMGNKTQL
jgi:hypothetical protein